MLVRVTAGGKAFKSLKNIKNLFDYK